MIKLRADSRSKRFQAARTFGQVVSFPDEFKIKDTTPDFVQPIGNTQCVSITCADVASDKDSLQYDFNDLYDRIPHDQNGSVPQDGLSETVKGGLLPVGQSQRIKVFNSYYESHTGGQDAFDSVRSALMVCKYPVAVWTRWFSNWTGEILPLGENAVSGHMYTAEGWKQINGEPMLVIEAWLGRKVYIGREAFNKAVSQWGCGTAVLSTLQMDINKRRTLIEYLVDACKNLVLLLREKMSKDTTPPVIVQPDASQPLESKPETPKRDVLAEFCQYISEYEGGPGDLNHRNNNPGNLRNLDGSFKKFKTWDEGMNALRDYVTRACTGQHKAYKPTFSFYQFFAVYAPSGDSNNPHAYAEFICKRLGISPARQISCLLSSTTSAG